MVIPTIPEATLRRIWLEQSISTEHLATSDGRPVRIISPGRPNSDGGPDCIDAKISIGNVTFHGDVELHVTADEWNSHKHSTDPHYNKVILHVVLSADPLSPPAQTESRRPIPLLVLHPFLDDRLQEAWSKTLLDEVSQSSAILRCKELNDNVPAKIIFGWLERLARERTELKIRRFEERLRQLVDESRRVVREPYPRYYGDPAEIPPPNKAYTKKDFRDKHLWEQLLYEGIMEGMGYSKNTRPFLALAKSMRLAELRKYSPSDSQTAMALLFGAAGLLPRSHLLHDPESRAYVAQLKKRWRVLRREFKGQLLNEADWLFFRLRPTNFPTIRLATMCFLLPKLFSNESFRRIIGIFREDASAKERMKRLSEFFTFEADEFWRRRYHFTGVAKSGQQTGRTIAATLGMARINDILVNTLIPIVLLHARLFNDTPSRKNALALLAKLPAPQKNSVSRVIQSQLVKDKGTLHSASLQQGSIQLYRFYCSQGRCAECAVGRLTSLAEEPQ